MTTLVACGILAAITSVATRNASSRSPTSTNVGTVMVGSAGAEYKPPRSGEVNHAVLVHVEHVNTHFERVRNSGVTIVREPADMPFGERQYTVEDAGGHRWTFSESIADVAPEEWGGRIR